MTDYGTVAKRTLGTGIALLLVTVVISGVSNFVNFRAVAGTNVDAWITMRNAFVVVLLIPLALLVRPETRRPIARAEWGQLVAIGLVGGAIPFLLYFHGFQLAASQGGAASASLGYRSLFLVATVLGVLVLRERVPRRFLLAAGLLMVGNVLLVAFTGSIWTDGTAYVLVATLLWACEYTVSKRLLRTLPASTVGLGRMGFGAGFLLAYLGASGQLFSIGGFSGMDWMALGFSALLLFAFVATWYAGLRSVDLSVAATLLVLAFPITWVLGVLASRNAFTIEQAAGAGTIAFGVAVLLGLAYLGRSWSTLVRWVRGRVLGLE